MSDLIDRQDAINTALEFFVEFLGGAFHEDDQRKLIAIYEQLPTAEPERKKGEWLWKLADNGWADHICSECGWTENTDIHVRLSYNYCPRCGADMRRKK